MENLAFICHSELDSAIANKIVVALEKAGIACWIAPRNIQRGTTYAAAIVQGIKKSNRLIFIFSKSSNKSDAVINEIENANALKIPIIPFKIDSEAYTDSLDYYIKSKQSINAYNKSLDVAIAELINSIDSTVPIPPPPPSPKKWLMPVILVLLVGLSFVIYFVYKPHNNNNATVNDTKQSPITMEFMKGNWLMEWYLDAGHASEKVSITGDGKYYVNGVYSFIISNFEYEESKRQIKFIKTSVLDQRVLLNTLTVENNNSLVGTESNYNVKFSKLPD